MSKTKKNDVEGTAIIVYPSQLGQVTPQDVAFCELFFNELLRSSKKKFYFAVNQKLGYVESDDLDVKEILTLLLKARQMNSFYTLFKRLLHHVNDPTCLGRLELIHLGKKTYYYIHEVESFPDFKWNISGETHLNFNERRY